MSARDCFARCHIRQSGLSLVELVIFIVIVSVGIAGILSVMDITTRQSADPLLRKQAISIAESLMEEIQLQPFTYCDPDDPKAETANGIADCTDPDTVEALEGEGEARFGATPFDNVNDYHKYNVNPATNIGGTQLSGYAASVTVSEVGVSAFSLSDASAALQINVRVTGPSGTDVTLTGYRLRYAPNSGP